METESVDAVLTDPPYSTGGTYAAQRQRPPSEKYQDHDVKTKRSSFTGDNRDQRSFITWATLWLTECHRVTKEGGSCMMFTDWRQLPAMSDALQAGGWVWRNIVVWHKPSARPICGEFTRQCEFVLFGVKDRLARSHRRCLPGVYTQSIVAHQRRMHLTEKPIPLLEALLEVTPPGATILDPFMGSATTGAACQNTGRKFIGIELSPDYFKIAKTRLKAPTN
ncbi:DNA-methyltransferase [Pseudodesulfovibrio methanolicus]|uniref:Methyltransferase n=1 Tax=Pseudodesulfovibrio methanolicus TaxID=3126690 RepID=A0ABZ2J6T9_9BACT